MERRDRDLPTAEDMERIARATIDGLPAHLREKLDGIVLRIPEFATEEQLRSVDIENRWHLTGLYHGRPIDEQSSWDSGDLPPIISLFRQPLLREWRETGVSFEALIHHVVIHEAGHHFGFSDEEMHALEQGVN